MKITQGLQPNHSEYMRLIADLDGEQRASEVYEELLKHLDELFTRGSRFTCAAFGISFGTKAEFEEWKKKEWDPIVDDRCTLTVENRNGRIYVSGDYGLILDDWSQSDLEVAREGSRIALRIYTAGYGLEYLEKWFSDRGGSAEISVEGEQYEFVPFDAALEKVKASAGETGTGDVRAEDSHDP